MSLLATLAQGLLAALRFFAMLASEWTAARQRQAGADEVNANALKEQASRVEKARSARRAVDPERLPDTDPDRRD